MWRLIALCALIGVSYSLSYGGKTSKAVVSGATCGNSLFGGCDKSRGLCWEADNKPKPTTTFCTCKAGYKFVNSKLRKGKCVDINECKTGVHSCDTVHGRCVNTLGSHYCTCKRGYVLDFTKTHCLKRSKIVGLCRGSKRRGCKRRTRRCRGRRGDEEDEVAESDQVKNELLGYFLSRNEDGEKGAKCKCEAGFRRCGSGLCKDINECRLRKNKCDLKRGRCHNSVGGYFCSCKKGFLLGPCGYKCYTPKSRPKSCTSQNLMARSLVTGDSDGFNDEATRALVHDVETEKAAASGKSIKVIETLQNKPCSGSKAVTEKFDVNRDGKVDVIVHLICHNKKYEVKSTFEKEAKWQPWSCWTECKATCHGGLQTRTRYCKNGLVGEGKCSGPATQHKTCYKGKKCPHRVRRDISTLTKAQKDDLVQGFKKYKEDSSTNGFWSAAGSHVFPRQCTNHATGGPAPCCYHGARMNFAIWHRAELLNYEEGLSRHLKDKTLGLPYWNWLRDDVAPALAWSKTYNGKPNPFASMTIRYDLTPHAMLQRDSIAQVSSIEQARTIYLNNAMKLMNSHTLHEFSEELENAHNWMHTAVCPQETSACTFSMGQLEYAGYDPLFFMHHTNVDRQIARMQGDMANAGETAWTRQSALEPQESIYHFNEPFNPFRNKTLTTFKRVNTLTSMQDLFYYQEMLGYKYDTLYMHGAATNAKHPKGDEEDETYLLPDGEKKVHVVQGTDSVQIMQYERNVRSNVKISYYVENKMTGVPAIKHCSKMAETDKRFVASSLILGSKSERPWKSNYPLLVSMDTFFTNNPNEVATTNFNIRACYTHNRVCTANCPQVSATTAAKIPSPQLMMYPRNIREDLMKFEWDTDIRMPAWTVNVKSARQWLHFWGKEMKNVVQVRNRRAFFACNTAGGHLVTCKGSCIVPTGYHYFVHKNKGLCRKGLRMSVLSTL